MKINFNGRCSQVHGKQPRKPVRWSGKFLVADSHGNALESIWNVNSGGPMNYAEAHEAARNLIDTLGAQLVKEHGHPIKKVTFNLISR